ncbi:recombinase family protein [Nocardioides marmoriginsengisoli]
MSDEGFSAKNLSRPSIAAALEMLRKGQASVLVVSKLDRLSRSLLDVDGPCQARGMATGRTRPGHRHYGPLPR